MPNYRGGEMMKYLIPFLMIIFLCCSCCHKQPVPEEYIEKEVSFYAGSGDGGLDIAQGKTFEQARHATKAVGLRSTMTSIKCNIWNGSYVVRRAYVPFKTCEIPDDAIIEKVVLRLFLRGGGTVTHAGGIVNATPANPEQLCLEDFDKMGAVDYPIVGCAYDSVKENAFNYYEFNKEGLKFINTKGWTTLGIRMKCDLTGAEPNPFTSRGFTARSSEYEGTEFDPLLTVTYKVKM